jgi:Leucine-rich repeat (LRR) protein
MKALTLLSLSHNQLNQLPLAVTKLKNLEMLLLSHNQLKALPAEISRLKKLKTLVLLNNPLTESYVQKLRILMPQTQIIF